MICDAFADPEDYESNTLFGNVTTWHSGKSTRTTASSYSAETHSQAQTFDAGRYIAECYSLLLGRNPLPQRSTEYWDRESYPTLLHDLFQCADCNPLLEHLLNDKAPAGTEKRLYPYVYQLEEAIREEAIKRLHHVDGLINLADFLTKESKRPNLEPFWELWDTGNLIAPPEEFGRAEARLKQKQSAKEHARFMKTHQ